MSAPLARLRCNRCRAAERAASEDGREHLMSRHQAPLDYAADERPPLAARPMFGLCEKILLASIATLGLISLWFGFGGLSQ